LVAMRGVLFRRLMVTFTALVIGAFLVVFLLTYRATGVFHWELLVHATVVTLVIWIVARAPTQRPTGRCPACGSRVFPTRRSSDRARMWTCSGCGFEIPRTWQRPRGPPTPPPDPNQPGAV